MLTETELIVLSGVKYTDSASIINTYSEQLGSLSFKVIRSHSRKRGRANALFTPLSIVQTTFNYYPTRAIQVAGELQIIHRPLITTIDPNANAVGLFLTDFLTRLLRNSATDPQLYRYLRAELLGFESLGNRGVSSFHLRMLCGVLHFLGILPAIEKYRKGYILDFDSGTFRPQYSCQEQPRALASELLIQFITEVSPEELTLDREERNALLALLLDYIGYHFPEIGIMKSPDILTQLFR